MKQLDLFAPPAPPTSYTVDPNGPVVQGQPDVTLTLPHPKLAWSIARIELHQHEDGRWMWATGCSGGGYKVGPKWGRFADTYDDALRHAAAELLARIDQRQPDSTGITPAQHRAARAFALQWMT